MTQVGTSSQEERIEGLSDRSETVILEDPTSPKQSFFFKDTTGHQIKLREKETEIREDIEASTTLAEAVDRIMVTGIEVDPWVRLVDFTTLVPEAEAGTSPTGEARTAGTPIPYITSLLISTVVSTICGVSIYLGVVTGKTLFDPYTSLFWFVGGIGIILMSLKGISSWRSK